MNSEGIPLEVVLSQLRDNDLVPDWPDFIEDSIRSGWHMGSLRTKISQTTGNVYGPDHRDEVLKRVDLYMEKKDTQV